MMKALVLCGGIPQVALIKELKQRGIYTVLADMNENVIGRKFADKFYPVSVLDVNGVKSVAEKERVDFIITACADQVLLVQAQVSEMLGLPCYISYETAKAVSSKEIMKKVFHENGIPTSKHIVMHHFNEKLLKDLSYPLIVKPVDSYSSRGVKKVFNLKELEDAYVLAVNISRTSTAIIEEFVEGEEITVDAYIEEGKAHILCISNIDKIPHSDGFVICRTRCPASLTEEVNVKVRLIADKIASAFHLVDTPMLIQMIVHGNDVSVVEFCARTGGGEKFRLIKEVSRFDVIKAVVELTLEERPHVDDFSLQECIINEFLYVKPGIFDHLEGFEELYKDGMIKEYFLLKSKGTYCESSKSSGDRVAYYTIKAKSMELAKSMDIQINSRIKVIDVNGNDILRHDLIATF